MSQDLDIDINVVSSPEHSPQPDYTSRLKFQPIPSTTATTMANRVLINTIADSSRLSPARTPPDNGKMSANSGYTSFTISNILSRNDPKKDSFASAANLPFVDASGTSVHDAAMISRYVLYLHRFYQNLKFFPLKFSRMMWVRSKWIKMLAKM